MQIQFGSRTYEFRPWRVSDGKVFDNIFALDTETTLIDEERFWLTPAYVLGGAFDGRSGYFVPRDRVNEFLVAHNGVPMVMHNAAFDLDVLNIVAPDAKVYDRVDRDEVYDTQLMHRLYVLGTAGHTASSKGESTLEHCAEHYLEVALPKDARDSAGRNVRLSYGQWLNRSPAEIDAVYLDYLGKDVVATHQLFQRLYDLLDQLLDEPATVWGYVSPGWLNDQVGQWGLQTHHIQIKASIVLRAITANGLTLDQTSQRELTARLEEELRRRKKVLTGNGFLPGEKGAGKALQAILRRLEREYPGAKFPRTPTGKYATAQESLGELVSFVPFLKALFDYTETEKLLTCFVGKLRKQILHPSFNVLARTGRTTSHGELNAQNLPRNDAVRGCFVPSRGHVYIKADYATIEMATLAQSLFSQFGLPSQMAAAINAGKDLHRLVAARVTGKTEGDVTDQERQQAKPINFGKPGAMGNASLKQYAQASYGVALSDEQVKELSDAWMELFPEMTEFLRAETDLGEEVAQVFGLTPVSHHEHTGSRKFLDHPANAGYERLPHPILGGMLLKVLKSPEPATQTGEPYHPSDVDYFWSRVEARLDVLPTNLHSHVRDRQPSVVLQRAVLGLSGRAQVFTLTGRLRAKASFAARRNTVFQGLAADGAKLALWNLWRAGFRIVNFVHDEVLVEVSAGDDLQRHAEEIRRLMIEGMKAVVPDVRVDVEYAACDRWYKKAKAVPGSDGRGLGLWRPAAPKEKQRAG